MQEAKRVCDSRTEISHIIMYNHMNGQRRLFGGQLMEWIDVAACITARRHAGLEVTTLSIDTLTFRAPAYLNETIVLIGQVTFVGSTSMEVRVDSLVEALDGKRRLVNRAYLVIVAIGEDEKPVPVPRLLPETEEEREEWRAGEERYRRRRADRRA